MIRKVTLSKYTQFRFEKKSVNHHPSTDPERIRVL